MFYNTTLDFHVPSGATLTLHPLFASFPCFLKLKPGFSITEVPQPSKQKIPKKKGHADNFINIYSLKKNKRKRNTSSIHQLIQTLADDYVNINSIKNEIRTYIIGAPTNPKDPALMPEREKKKKKKAMKTQIIDHILTLDLKYWSKFKAKGRKTWHLLLLFVIIFIFIFYFLPLTVRLRQSK